MMHGRKNLKSSFIVISKFSIPLICVSVNVCVCIVRKTRVNAYKTDTSVTSF